MTRSANPYEVQSTPLAGTQRVFAATRAHDGAHVLIKRPRGAYPTPEEVAALRHEHAVLSRLSGAPVPAVLEFVDDGTNLGLVLEPAPGRSVESIIAEGPPDVSRCVALALAMSQALAEVHARRFVHRDVKPHHFFVDEESGQCQLIDFGLATQLIRERQVSVQLDQLHGTLAYISPEQTGRTNHSVDRRSDLYSFGVTLYELCTGERPFQSEDALELLHAHIARTPVAPRTHRPELPQVLEDIILRLLAKSPDARYQTAAGLVADLRRVHEELSSSGQVTPFALGQNDHDGELRVPEKLYGRAQQRTALLDMVRRVKDGGRELTLIAGPPGVGKSALVHEVHQEIVSRGHFVSGKFDQYNRGVPYSALATACGELIRVYLASSPEVLDDWKERLKSALGDNARVVLDLVPELEVVIGEQPEVSPLPPMEAQARFERTFRRFMEASACEGAPLVLFLDDLQWADSSSLAVLELVLSSSSQGHLLVIGNYRDSEVDAKHPLSSMLDRLANQVHIERIELAPLSRADVGELVTDALSLTEQSPDPLADLIFDKTSGNPFFVGQFLQRLGDEGYLRFEAERGYSWDLETIAVLDATDNVVDLVVERLAALAPEAQNLLRDAACIGHTFRLNTLSVIAEAAPRDVVRALAPAVAGGYLLPLDKNHRLLEDLLDTNEAKGVDASYRFAHDRVQQAALSTIDASERARTHLRVGRLLLSAAGEDGPSDEQLFDVVSQLNLGREHIAEASERLRLARLNLRAAKRAKSAAAHVSVLEMTGLCLELLGSEPFSVDHEASLSAHLLAAEAHYLTHDDERALAHIEDIERNTDAVLERVPARNLKTNIITNQGKPVEATAVSIETLAMLGITLPDPHNQDALGPAIGEAFGAYQGALGARDVAALRDLPAMTDPEKLALVGTIAGAIPSVFQWNPSLMVLLVLKAVRLPLEHGTAPISPFFYAQYGIVHNVVTGDSARAHEFGLLALELCQRPEHAAARGGVEFIYAEFLSPWVRPRVECIAHFQQGIVAGLDAGDQVHAAFCMAVGVAEALYAGLTLSGLKGQIPGYLQALTEQGDVLNHMLLVMLERGIACLRGATPTPGSMDGEGFSEDEFEAQSPPPVKAHFGVVKAMVRFLFGDLEATREITEAIVPPPGVVFKVEYVFYHGMACARLAASASAEQREELLSKADADLASFEPWVNACSQNFLALSELLRAELHAVRGQTSDALNAYENAVAAANAAGAVHHLALAQECEGRFHAREGRKNAACMSLREARRHYELWGAAGKVNQLVEEFPEVARTDAFASADDTIEQASSFLRTVSNSMVGGVGHLDMTSAMRAVNAIASELRLEPLLERLMQILVENAGATRGVLLLAEEDGLVLRAEQRVDPEGVSVDLNEALDDSRSVPSSIVRYCARTLTSVVLDDASRDNRFAQDPFVVERNPKSVTCLPLVHHGQLVGVLYLENAASAAAFHAARIERLEFLGGHAAVALQNARLYDKLEAANQSLERRVRERTAELSERNGDMRRVLDNVKQGLLTINLEGQLASEHSTVVTEWLGEFEPKTSFRDYIARTDPAFAESFALSFEQLLDGVLPEELLVSQLPNALTHDERHFEFGYEAIHVDGKLTGLLIVVDDVTDAVRRAREEAEQKEVLALCRALSKDRAGLFGFLAEARTLIEQLDDPSLPQEVTLRNLHTLKGNAALFDLDVFSERCHTAEQAVLDGIRKDDHIASVVERFEALQEVLASVAGDGAQDRIEVSRDVLRRLAQDLTTGMTPGAASAVVERLLLEPVSGPLEHLGDYARALAARLGKGKLTIEIDDGGLLVDRERSAPLFASLVHLVRNAVDHGLEEPEQRRAAGKGLATLSLSAVMSDGQVCITVSDDGRGIDWERARSLAAAHGLAADTERALTEALFAPELTTRQEATSVSGRGVGLAAVKSEVERLSGRIEVDSSGGAGTRFTVCLPAQVIGIQGGSRPARRRHIAESWPAPAH